MAGNGKSRKKRHRGQIIGTPNLFEISPPVRELALRAFNEGDALAFVILAPSQAALRLVFDNIHVLKDRGIYEPALVHAFAGTRTNHSHWSECEISFLFEQADRRKLREAGDTLPGEPVTIYRGIAGHGRRRRKCSYSWTHALNVACWFAVRDQLANPAVLTATVQPDEILCRLRDGREGEFLVRPKAEAIERIKMSLAEMKQGADTVKEQWDAEKKQQFAEANARRKANKN